MRPAGAWLAAAALSALLLAVHAQQPLEFTPTEYITLTMGDYLEDLPGAAKLEAAAPHSYNRLIDEKFAELQISMVAAQIVGPINTPSVNYSFYAYAFKDNSDGTTGLHGPPFVMKAGTVHRALLQNELTLPTDEIPAYENDPALYSNYFRLPTHTNLHLHGLWAYSGVPDLSQHGEVPYIGMGDNVYLNIPPKPTPESTPYYNNYSYVIEPYHLPGTHWYHPHFHGSSSLQLQSASGPILVKSEVDYLTEERGCGPLQLLLDTVKTRILYIQAFMFQDAQDTADNPFELFDIPGYDQISDIDDPPYVAYPNNPLCCNTSRTGYGFNATRVDVALVNGGLSPKIRLAPNVPQLWRIFNANWKGYMDLNILKADNSFAPCKIHLISKDGVYMMEIPRLVKDIILATANRAEVLIECDGNVGDRYFLASGQVESFGPGYPYADDPDYFYQQNIAEIVLTAPDVLDIVKDVQSKAAQLTMLAIENEGCTPKRPSYAADLRQYQLQGNLTVADANYNTTLKQLFMTENNPYGCTINLRNFSYPTPNPIVLPLGQVLEINYINQADHPSHLHDNPQQIYYLNVTNLLPNTTLPNYFKEGDWGDTWKLPQLVNTYGSNTENILTTRIQPGPFNGYSVWHCHFLHHQDVGCMSVVQKPCPSNPYPGPYEVIEYPCPGGFQFPMTGDFGVETYMGTANLPVNRHPSWKRGLPG